MLSVIRPTTAKSYNINLVANSWTFGGKGIAGVGGGDVSITYEGTTMNANESFDGGIGLSLGSGYSVTGSEMIMHEDVYAENFEDAIGQIELIEGWVSGLGTKLSGTLHGYAKRFFSKKTIFEIKVETFGDENALLGWDQFSVDTEWNIQNKE